MVIMRRMETLNKVSDAIYESVLKASKDMGGAQLIAAALINSKVLDEIVASALEVYARDPLFVRDIAEAVTGHRLDTMHLEDANVAYAAAADTLAAVVEALKEEARK